MRPPNPASWFGGFAQGESTYDSDGELADRNKVNTQVNVLDGWNPHEDNPLYDRAAPAKWFQETRSGSDRQAWQTFYPAESASIAGNRVETGTWYEGAGGTWQQEYQGATSYNPVLGTVSKQARNQDIPASWFDSGVKQLDGFGRRKLPGINSPRSLYDWKERSVNTSLECDKPGCIANASLLAPFDFNTEVAKNCRLSIFFRPTDFDDWYKGEFVEWIMVNNKTVNTKCYPHSDGCNQTAQRPLLPCVSDVSVDLLMKENGNLDVAAKIPQDVDECPYNNMYLSAVPMVTCMVAPKTSTALSATASSDTASLSCTKTKALQCKEKGCSEKITIPVDSDCAALGNCMLSLNVTQTDFDNKDGTNEFLEFISVDGVVVKSNVTPGGNPCKALWSGTPADQIVMNYTALGPQAINVTGGAVVVEAKISQFVDECASQGQYLLDAMSTVTCGAANGTANGTSFLQAKASAAQGIQRKLKLRGYSL
jgi:hypothetical protein